MAQKNNRLKHEWFKEHSKYKRIKAGIDKLEDDWDGLDCGFLKLDHLYIVFQGSCIFVV